MWQIEEHRRVDKQLSGAVPIEVLKRYEKWKDIARISGPQGPRAIKGFHDEALFGEWKFNYARVDLSGQADAGHYGINTLVTLHHFVFGLGYHF